MRVRILLLVASTVTGIDGAYAQSAVELERACGNAAESGIPEAECEDRVVEAWDAMAVLNAVERVRNGASIDAVSAESGIPSSVLQARLDELLASQADDEEE
jgi:hypothetical protein